MMRCTASRGPTFRRTAVSNASSSPSPRGSTRRRLLQTLALSGAAIGAGSAFAQDTLRFIVPFPAGGAADSMARVLVDKVKDEMKQNVIVENRAGASTRLAAEMLKQSAPDGKTVLMTVLDTTVIAPLVYQPLRYDPAKDFAPSTMVTEVTYGIAVKAEGPHKTLAQFLDAARAKKDQAAVGISGLGSTLHSLAFDFARQSKAADMQVIPFQGGPAMVNNLLGDQLPAAMDGLGVFVQQHKAGKVRVLAVSGDARAPQMPEVPTFKELGMPTLAFGMACALYAPAGTPPAKIDEWNRAMRKVLAWPNVKQRLVDIGHAPVEGSTPAEVTAREARMTAHWTPIVKATGFKGE
jgi:tripartite-type tricarboxylate transporter receptor subunit TctC